MTLQQLRNAIAFFARKLYRFDGEAMVIDFEDEQDLPEELRQKFYSDEYVAIFNSQSSFLLWSTIGVWLTVGNELKKLRLRIKSQCSEDYARNMDVHAIILKTKIQNQYQLRILVCENRALWIKLCFADHPNLNYMLAYEKARSSRPGLFALAERWSS